jgi:hypothetical protein
MDDIGQGDLAAIAALSIISMGNIPNIRCADRNALSSLAHKGNLLAIEPLDNFLAYWKQQKHENNIDP